MIIEKENAQRIAEEIFNVIGYEKLKQEKFQKY